MNLHPKQLASRRQQRVEANPASRRKHIAFLDGLRGLAVLLVLVHHYGFLNIGWVGVDLFFVLSGYLITGILRASRNDLSFWKPFWIKRMTRIMPPFLLLLLTTVVLGSHTSWLQMLAYIFSLGDVMAYLRPHFEVLQPLWSLAVEEHFYIVWPFAVRFLRRKTLIAIAIAIVVIEPATRALATVYMHDWQIVYFLTPFRLDGITLGSLLAIVMESERGKTFFLRWSALAGILAVLLFGLLRIFLGHRFTRNDPTWMYNGACYALVAFVCLFLISFLITHQHSFACRILSWRPIVFIGEISYGLYLYQVIIKDIVVKLTRLGEHQALLVGLPLAVLVAWLSFRFFEKPLIARGRRIAKALVDKSGKPQELVVSTAL